MHIYAYLHVFCISFKQCINTFEIDVFLNVCLNDNISCLLYYNAKKCKILHLINILYKKVGFLQ